MSESWKYGKWHEKNPIERGEVWRVGSHIFAVGDIEGSEFDIFVRDCVGGGEKSGIGRCRGIYCDPPWNLGIAKRFRANAADFEDLGKGGILGAEVDVDGLFDRILGVGVDMRLRVALEVGVTGYGIAYRAVNRCLGGLGVEVDRSAPGFENLPMSFVPRPDGLLEFKAIYSEVDVWYGSVERPIVSRVFCMDLDRLPGVQRVRSSCAADWARLMRGKDDVESAFIFCEQLAVEFPVDVAVFDPCMGVGTTACGAARAGIGSFGFDMNKRKLAEAIGRVAGITGEIPHHIGHLGERFYSVDQIGRKIRKMKGKGRQR